MYLKRGITPKGTYGKLYDHKGEFICFTLEQIWLDNLPGKSCVPNGHYELIPHQSPKFGSTFALKNLALDVGVFKGQAIRYGCLFHVANYVHQLQGCIAPVSQWGQYWSGVQSQLALTKVLDYIHRTSDHRLIIQSNDTTIKEAA